MARPSIWEKSFLVHFHVVAIGHPICIVNMPYVTVIIRYNCRLYRVPMFIAIITFYGRIVNVCQEAHVCQVSPNHSCQVTPGP